MNDVYGWVGYGTIGVHWFGFQNDKALYYQTVEAGSQGTFSLSGRKASCMHIYSEQGIPVQSRKPVASKKMDAEVKTIQSLNDEFVKLNGLRLVKPVSKFLHKGQVCTYSSLTKAESPPKTNAFFTVNERAGDYLKYDVVTDSGLFYPPRGRGPEPRTLRFDKTHLVCNGYAWSSSKNFKAMKKRVESGEFDNIKAAEIELQGMTLSSYQQRVCEIDNVKVKKLN